MFERKYPRQELRAEVRAPCKYPELSNPPRQPHKDRKTAYMIECGENFTANMQTSPYFIVAENKNEIVIQRYSDKYKSMRASDDCIDWKPHFNRMPSELNMKVRAKRKIAKRRHQPYIKGVSHADVLSKLDQLKEGGDEKQDKEDENDDEDDDDEEEGGLDEDADEYEGGGEDEDDYTNAYFDNGENEAGDDDGDDEAVM